ALAFFLREAVRDRGAARHPWWGRAAAARLRPLGRGLQHLVAIGIARSEPVAVEPVAVESVAVEPVAVGPPRQLDQFRRWHDHLALRLLQRSRPRLWHSRPRAGLGDHRFDRPGPRLLLAALPADAAPAL